LRNADTRSTIFAELTARRAATLAVFAASVDHVG
jgi:hypothetical protein